MPDVLLPGCAFRCSPFGTPGSPLTIDHAPDCTALAGWSWPIPPEHAGPCACRRAEGYEHFTEHTPHGCSAIPADLAERLMFAAGALPEDEVPLQLADDVLEEMEAVAAHRRRAHPDLYAELFTDNGPPG